MARARTLSAPYFYTIHCNNNKSLYDQIDSKLIGSNIYWKKTSQTVTIDKDDCAFSVVYSLLKIKNKVYIFENIFRIFKWYNDFAFHISNRVGICRMPTWVRNIEPQQRTIQFIILGILLSSLTNTWLPQLCSSKQI